MSSSLARTRSLRKPAQGSTTDLPSTASGAPTQRPVSPSRLPGPRSAALARSATRTVSSGSLNEAAAAAAKKKKTNPISSLLSRTSSTRQSATANPSPRQKDATSSGTGPSSAPSTRPTVSSSLARTSSTREPALTRARHPASASTTSLVGSAASASSRPTTSGTGSSSSTRPTTSGGVPSPKRPTPASGPGHVRARSVATLNGSTVLRPPSQPTSSSASVAPKPRPTSLYGAPSGSSTSSLKPRPPSATDRPTSSKSHLSSAPSTRPTRAASTSLKQPPKPSSHPQQPTRASPTSPPRNKPLLKPAFTTLQQHYSPAKNLAPKPSTASILAPPSPSKLPTNVALSAETSRLQTELLQLHLLHRDLPSVTSQYHASAKSTLAARHSALAKSSRDLVSLESQAAEHRNVAALHKWASSSSSSSSAAPGRGGALEHKIQHLDALLTTLWSLDAPGGKHHRLVRLFERWAATLPDLETARDKADSQADPSALLDANLDVRFVGGLDARWKEECAALVRRLEGWDRQLRDLEYTGEEETDEGGAAQVSSLKRMLDGCGSLVRDMLAELAVMEEIEKAAVERETEWIKKMNRQGDDGRRDTPRAGAVWRVV
ncbi:hypothetical protein C8035_v001778 [Colletotrichum spinosum]|uniref:Uncharacterized protein n=1 Tax=Colletotrichum spinosum TaxID=1347390 RepID=A0A4R8Q3N2_9PEZI|nr:hypothetical protein C8035_v001778 [Colletotrichum spinosum]